MYKLFLTLRYLTRKAIVIFPILVVWLCVSMMIIVASIMGGFVDHVKQANRDLLGDIIISTKSGYGFPNYQALQDKLATLKTKDGHQLVQVSTPLIKSYGLINFPGHGANNFAQIVGIDPAGRTATTNFRQTLYRQYTLPTQATEILTKTGLPATGKILQERAQKALSDAETTYSAADWALAVAMNPTLATIPGFAPGASTAPTATPAKIPPLVTGRALEKLKDSLDTAQVNLYLAQRVWRLAGTLDPAHSFATSAEISNILVPKSPSFDISPAALAINNLRIDPKDPPSGCIPAVGIGINGRDRHGDFLRPPELEDLFCELTVVPLSGHGLAIEPQIGSFIVVDDTYTQVIDVDSTYVFAPFNKIQKLALMDAGVDANNNPLPARCTELQLKTFGHDAHGDIDPKTLLENRELVEEAVHAFIDDPLFAGTVSHGIDVETWDQKQALYIAAIENEKGLITFILGLMSLVVVVVIFLIFYMIVRDKTRDIGIIKALGGSEAGVMSIFMLYGTFIGVVGGLAGTLTGVVFVWNTNFIHDKIIYGIFGVMIWRRDIYLFDKIPDTVHPGEVAAYLAAAIVAGFLGATLPAVLAAYQDPVRAVRYE